MAFGGVTSEKTPNLSALEAVSLALRQDPALRLLELDVERARGAALAASGAFDRLLAGSGLGGFSQQDLTSAESEAAEGEADQRTDWGLEGSLAWVVNRRSGVRMTPSVSISAEESDVDLIATLPGATSSTGFDLYSGRLNFAVEIPWARGRGAESVAAEEVASTLDVEASKAALRHGASLTTRAVLGAYWTLAAASARLAVLEESLAAQQRLQELTRALIDTDQLPRVEIARSLAREASARGDVDNARRELTAARVALAAEIGLSLDDLEGAPLSTDPLPEVPEAVPGLDPALVSVALGGRADRRSLELLVASGGVLARAAELDLRDLLDTSAGVSYGRLSDQGFDDLRTSSLDGPSAFTSVTWERPLGNRAARGALAERDAEVELREVRLADLERSIRSGVIGAWAELADTVAAVRRADEALAFAEDAIAAELERFRLGSSTLIDTLLTEDRRTEAELDRIALRLRWVQLLTDLRFETATLLRANEEGFSVAAGDLVSLPEAR
jgi:outer membrane protein TolC